MTASIHQLYRLPNTSGANTHHAVETDRLHEGITIGIRGVGDGFVQHILNFGKLNVVIIDTENTIVFGEVNPSS